MVRWDVDFFEGEGGGPVEFLLVGGLVLRVEKGKRGWVGVGWFYLEEVGDAGLGEVDVGVGGIFGLGARVSWI